MPKIKVDFRKLKPATGGGRADYIKPARYAFKVVEYSDKKSAGGKQMHTYTSAVVGGTEAGKKIIDRFPMPGRGDSTFPLEKFLAFLEACGVKATGKQVEFDPSKVVGKQFQAEVQDERQDARTENGTTYPARTTSGIGRYLIPGSEDEDEDEDADDEDDEDSDDDDDEDDEEDDEEDEDDDEDEDEDEDDDDEPEPEPVKKSKAKAKAAPKSKAKAAPAAKAKKKSKAKDDDDEDFPFDD